MTDIRIGTASWADPSLVKSGWYPKGADAADRLRFYANSFRLVEVDASYYAIPRKQMAENWVARTPKDFVFNVKAFGLLTGHPVNTKVLPKDVVRPGKANIYAKDLAVQDVDRLWDDFCESIAPLHNAGKLGSVLFQFPPWFVANTANRNRILECAKRMAPLPICVEFRHSSWMNESHRNETLDLLEGHGLPYVCVDMPQGFRNSIPPVIAATADLAVIRFHGHNDAEWESKSVQRRFAYLYTDDELLHWAPRIKELGKSAKQIHVLMNNCHSDYAVRNASQLAGFLEGLE